MQIDAVLFDLDGTLLDTLTDLANAVNQTLTGEGLPPLSADGVRLIIGSGAANLIRSAIAAASSLQPEQVPDEQAERLLKIYGQAYERNWDDQTRAYNGIDTLLAGLAAAGIKLAVLSNKPDSFTQKMVKRYFPAIKFAAVAGQLPGYAVKPDPALALALCAQIGVDPRRTALLGDSGSDMVTAVRAGMLPIGALWGFRDAHELIDDGARWLAATPDDLTRLLTGRPS